VPGRRQASGTVSYQRQEAAARNAQLDATRAAQSAVPLLQNDELERIFQDLQDFDIDQLASELPLDDCEDEEQQQQEMDVAEPTAAYASVEASTSTMESNFLTVPSSPSGSSCIGFDACVADMSPRSFSEYNSLYLDESTIGAGEELQKQQPLLGDPMLGSPQQAANTTYSASNAPYDYSPYGWDAQEDAITSFEQQTFYEEFVQTSY